MDLVLTCPEWEAWTIHGTLRYLWCPLRGFRYKGAMTHYRLCNQDETSDEDYQLWTHRCGPAVVLLCYAAQSTLRIKRRGLVSQFHLIYVAWSVAKKVQPP